jgi:chromosome segregation ATPase
MENAEVLQRLVTVEERSKSNTKRLNEVEVRQEKSEQILNSLDKTLSVALQQIENIAEDLKTTSVNFKEAVMRSSNANSKETELLKEKYNELERKYEKLDSKLEQETVLKDANNWRNSKKQVIAWITAGILALIAGALGISKFF